MKNTNKNNIEVLELDYTEAVELFSSETLNAMQMAKVTGGTEDWGKAVEVVKDAVKEIVTEALTEAISAITDGIADIVEVSKDSEVDITTDDGDHIVGKNVEVEIEENDSTKTIKATPKRP